MSPSSMLFRLFHTVDYPYLSGLFPGPRKSLELGASPQGFCIRNNVALTGLRLVSEGFSRSPLCDYAKPNSLDLGH